jgi:hypothetical protein
MPKPKKPRRRKDTLLYMSALQMMEGLSLIEKQGEYLELHAFLADLLQKAEEAGEDGVVGVSKTVADRYDRLFRWPDRSGLSQGAGGLVF